MGRKQLLHPNTLGNDIEDKTVRFLLLKKSTGNAGFLLGRALLQETYLNVNYHRDSIDQHNYPQLSGSSTTGTTGPILLATACILSCFFTLPTF